MVIPPHGLAQDAVFLNEMGERGLYGGVENGALADVEAWLHPFCHDKRHLGRGHLHAVSNDAVLVRLDGPRECSERQNVGYAVAGGQFAREPGDESHAVGLANCVFEEFEVMFVDKFTEVVRRGFPADLEIELL